MPKERSLRGAFDAVVRSLCGSMAWKIFLTFLAVNLAIELAVIVSVPHLFYHYLKKEAVRQSVVDMQSLGVAGNGGFFLFISFQNSDRLLEDAKKLSLNWGEEGLTEEEKEELIRVLDRRSGFHESQRYAGLCVSVGGESICSDGSQNLMEQIQREEAYQRFLETEASSTLFLSQLQDESYLTFVRRTDWPEESSILLLTMVWSKFFGALDRMRAEGIEDVVFYYEEGDQIVHQEKKETKLDLVGLRELVAKDHPQTHVEVETSDGFDFVLPCTFEEGPQTMYVFYHQDKAALLSAYQSIFWFVRSILGISFLASSIFLLWVVERRMKKVRELAWQMERVRQGDYSVRVRADTGDEIEALARSFNHMAETTSENIARRVEQEKKQSLMQYTILASEIHPHFIYNTLNTIIYLAALRRNEDIERAARALIKILKDRLKVKEYQSFDTIRNEMELNQSYLQLQAIMHGDLVETSWEVDEGLLGERIPKSILQPLIENALVHGIYQKKDADGQIVKGRITVAIRREGERFVLEISDTGIGMTAEEVERFIRREASPEEGENHIGLRNIRLRLWYLYGDDYEIRCESQPGQGCKISVSFEGQGREVPL